MNDDPTNPAEALAQLRRLTPVCERVAEAWQQGARPSIEEELATVSEADRPALLGELLLLEWTYRRQHGEPVDAEVYEKRFACCANVVQSAWRRWLEGTTIDANKSLAYSTLSPAPKATYRPWEEIPGERAHLKSGYENLEQIGIGGMGVVFRADDPRLGRKVALKRLNRLTPEGLERFRKEAVALARLQHPNVVQVFHLDEMEGEPVIVMEYVTGGSLEKLLQNGPLSAERSATLVATLARAVAAAHAAGVVHRDLKPANVLLASPIASLASPAASLASPAASAPGDPRGADATPLAKIADFGLARMLDDATGQTLSGTICGTAAYMSPEQASGKVNAVGPATDVWALGVILYRCLTGRLPFVGDSMLDTLERVKTCPPEPFHEIEGVPAELAAVCLACLNRDSKQRPTTNELASRLERSTPPPSPLPEAERASRKPEAQARESGTAVFRPLLASGRGLGARSSRTLRRGVAAVVGLLVLAGLTLAGLKLFNRPRKTEAEISALPPPRITKFRVVHRRIVEKDGKKVTEDHGEIGKDSFEPRFDDAVQIEVALAEAGFLYLLALNPNGEEQLLWPEDKRQPPAKVRELRWPPKQASGEEGGFYLNDEPGLQALAVVVASEPLPAYEEWRARRGPAEWKKMPGGKGVWLADANGVHAGRAGVGIERGEVKALPGSGETPMQKRLRRVMLDLRQGGAETVEVLAFPVRAKEGG